MLKLSGQIRDILAQFLAQAATQTEPKLTKSQDFVTVLNAQNSVNNSVFFETNSAVMQLSWEMVDFCFSNSSEQRSSSVITENISQQGLDCVSSLLPDADDFPDGSIHICISDSTLAIGPSV